MSTERDIKEAIRAIANGGGGKTFFTAEVVKVTGDTCTVKSDGLEMSDVAICAIGGASGNSLVVVPKVGSTVLIADLSDGTRRDLCIVKYTEVESITINGGNLGGLVNVCDLVDRLNEIEKDINDLKGSLPGCLTGSTTSPTGITNWSLNPLTETTRNDIEDTKIKH